jgi:hypothetical protein
VSCAKRPASASDTKGGDVDSTKALPRKAASAPKMRAARVGLSPRPLDSLGRTAVTADGCRSRLSTFVHSSGPAAPCGRR